VSRIPELKRALELLPATPRQLTGAVVIDKCSDAIDAGVEKRSSSANNISQNEQNAL